MADSGCLTRSQSKKVGTRSRGSELLGPTAPLRLGSAKTDKEERRSKRSNELEVNVELAAELLGSSSEDSASCDSDSTYEPGPGPTYHPPSEIEDESDSSSDELSKAVTPSVGSMRKRKRSASVDSDSIGPYVLKKLKKIEAQMSVSSSDPVLNFGTFVADLFRQVPDQLRRHCQRMITNILFDYADGRVPTVVVHAD